MQCCERHTRGAWLVVYNAVQAVWKHAGQKAGFTALIDAARGLPRKFYTTGTICDIIYIPDHHNLRGLTPILADSWEYGQQGAVGYLISTYQGKGLCQRAQMTRLKRAWAECDSIVVPFLSDTMGSMTGESAVSLCLFA